MGVQLNIKSAKAYALAQRLSAATGESLTDAVTNALDERLRGLEKTQRRHELETLLKGSRARWKPDMLATDHGDFLYDETGLPA